MTDYFLKFASKEQALELLKDYEGSIDVIGLIYERTGGTDEEPVMARVEGWHVNVRGPESEHLSPFVAQVQTPLRVWL